MDNNDIDNDIENDSTEDDLDILTDDALWDILDDFTNDKHEIKNEIKHDNSICQRCNSDKIVFSENRNRNICNNCGNVCDEILDDNPEWNNHEDGKKEVSRGGNQINTFFPITSLGTTINYRGFSRIKMLHSWGQMPYKERSLAEVLKDIDEKCKKYKISKAIIDNAKILYNNIRDTKHILGKKKGKNIIIRGINRRQVIAACVYYGANLQKCSRSYKEIADIFNYKIKQITRGCRKFLEYMQENKILFDIMAPHGSDFITRIGGKLNLDKAIINLAITISNNATMLDIGTNHQPISIAAACIYLASQLLNKQIVKKDLLSEFSKSEVTVNKTYKSIFKYRNIVINNDYSNNLYCQLQMTSLNDIDTDDIDIITITKETNNLELVILDSNNNDIKYDNNFDMNNVDDTDNNDLFLENKLKKRGRKPKNKYNIDSDILSNMNSLSLDNTESNSSSINTTETSENSDSITTIIKKKRGRPRKVVIQNESTN
jgi:transcription initiation factor TFIIB